MQREILHPLFGIPTLDSFGNGFLDRHTPSPAPSPRLILIPASKDERLRGSVDRKIKSPFTSWVWMPQRLLPAAPARWRQWGKTEKGALSRDGTQSEAEPTSTACTLATSPRVSSWP